MAEKEIIFVVQTVEFSYTYTHNLTIQEVIYLLSFQFPLRLFLIYIHLTNIRYNKLSFYIKQNYC